MTSVRTIRYTYAARPARVLALLCDPEYLRARCQADGDRNICVSVEGAHVRVERDHTIDLPPWVRGLVKPTNRPVETSSWRRSEHGWEAAYAVAARGMPGTLGGTMRIAGDELTTRFEVCFEVVARVPLVANKLESLMADGFATYLVRNAEHLAQTLRGGHQATRASSLQSELSG